jgi:hypothetical protein
MIAIALCAILCGAESWVDVAEWREDNEAWLREYLELAHGTASHDTFSRVFRLLDAKVFEACFREWVMSLVGVIKGVVAINGKTVRGSVGARWSRKITDASKHGGRCGSPTTDQRPT